MFLDFVFDFWNGVVEGGETSHGFTLLVDDELGEVPLDEVAQESALLGLQVFKEGVGVATIHVDLAELKTSWKNVYTNCDSFLTINNYFKFEKISLGDSNTFM